MVSGSDPDYRPFECATKRQRRQRNVHRLPVRVVAGPERPRAGPRREGGRTQKVRAVARRTLAEGQAGAQALRFGGGRRARGDLAPGLGEVGGQGAFVVPRSYSLQPSAFGLLLKADSLQSALYSGWQRS